MGPLDRSRRDSWPGPMSQGPMSTARTWTPGKVCSGPPDTYRRCSSVHAVETTVASHLVHVATLTTMGGRVVGHGGGARQTKSELRTSGATDTLRRDVNGTSDEATNSPVVSWHSEISAHATIAELQGTIVSHLREEAAGRYHLQTAGAMLRDLLATFEAHAPEPMLVSLVWGRGFPVITVSLRGPLDRTHEHRVVGGLERDVRHLLDVPLVRDHRVATSLSAGVRVVVILDMRRRRSRPWELRVLPSSLGVDEFATTGGRRSSASDGYLEERNGSAPLCS